MKLGNVLHALERFAPLPLQEGYDHAGLQIGLPEAEVSGALLCLDVTESIVDEALSKGCNLIVSHHPLLFHGLHRISGEDMVQRVVAKAIKHDLAIISMHTNLDAAQGGVNWKIAEKLGLSDCRPLGKEQEVEGVRGSEGLLGRFAEPIAADDFVELVQRVFKVECVMTNELLRRPIETVALCGGAGSFLLPTALAAGADAFLTGEMHYHEYFGHEQEIQLCVIGHYQSEQYTSELLQEILQKSCPELRTVVTEEDTNPILYFHQH
ncbi:Nif3-like dinuclear metal center hexameric protein [Prevotella sp. AGR2160]|uniref:Nif3-like dinuclear metal center hexameric protein n=1 Tax=Prevotella sp. AGR2160 TaxID=1280674 RepID=UPI000404F36F|nr:Nif3-like dinuclear metal center hexameric protein [Prevotella sp. AGR2160]